ncbi:MULTISPECIES: CoxG family protein [unclassified Paenibacillus]|uniref:CoxG family protein n=1 Tax=unclassified Paenibacillus TaxID=185978 RepID=UPI0009A5D957|nr:MULTISPECIES: SRPBCC family protein [unclassified Paenibacillus]SLK20823.1 Carbon monoxide dehydrogenase subunit G [Paenibacillus sp. RU5A]SOC76322.1 Carbon monoxide dehydrogenase subunit G [Paenibacillus sp. RU26A]SOC77958.1 Carbon monoxide dehydrogenase subunit G [Paenibacillus sp. RU5M]
MPNGSHQIQLEIPIHTIWDFVRDMNKWAPLVPGYIEHEILNEHQSTWSFKGDLGFVKKTVKLQIDITQWQEPTRVSFDLTGLSDNFSGNGYFEADAINKHLTMMTGYLDITAKGAMGPMINSILKNFVPKTAFELSEAIAAEIIEIEKAG